MVEQLARQRSVFGGTREGVVIRVAKSFDDKEFSACIAKWVRPGHVQETEQHWSLRTVVKQRLCSHREEIANRETALDGLTEQLADAQRVAEPYGRAIYRAWRIAYEKAREQHGVRDSVNIANRVLPR